MYNTSHTEDFIKNMYTKIKIFKPEQFQLSYIARCLGIKVFYWNEGSRALFLKGCPYIFINSHLSKQQQWQDFCHELAHVLMHSGHQGRLDSLFIEYQEYKANNFMYHACVPTFMLDELELYDCTPSTVMQLQELFNVEYEFAEKRLTQYINNHRFVPYWNSVKR